MFLNVELDRIWKELIVAYFKELCHYILEGRLKEITENGLVFEVGTS